MKQNEASYPLKINPFCGYTVLVQAQNIAHLVQ